MAFPALMEMMLLYMTVEVGFVDGISAATTPIGTPISVTFVSSFSLKTPTVFMFFTDSQVIALPSLFFNTLSSHFPNPVSWTAIFASSSACSIHAEAMEAQMASNFSCGNVQSVFSASFAFATRSLTSWIDCRSRSIFTI